MGYMPYVWMFIMVVMAVIEGVTSQLVSIWFVIGALAAAVVSFFVPSFVVQFMVFAVVSFLCLLITRPLVKKAKRTKFEPTNADKNIGKTAVVIEEINNTMGTGQAKVGGVEWTARSYDDNVIIPAGAEATVENISGVKLILKSSSN